VVEGSDLVVTREAYANNTSKYLLNGKTSTFTDVTEVFKGKGVDLDNNRFLILQARGACVGVGLCARAAAARLKLGRLCPGRSRWQGTPLTGLCLAPHCWR
jgi:hypothetical protein